VNFFWLLGGKDTGTKCPANTTLLFSLWKKYGTAAICFIRKIFHWLDDSNIKYGKDLAA
jgi:hypothetical protein